MPEAAAAHVAMKKKGPPSCVPRCGSPPERPKRLFLNTDPDNFDVGEPCWHECHLRER